MSDYYQMQSLELVGDEQATAEVEELFAPSRSSLGFVPNMYRAMAQQPSLLEQYLDGYARFRKTTAFNPAEQEVVLLAISYDNECHYCTAAHSMVADKVSDVPEPVLTAIRTGSSIPDEKLSRLYKAARSMSATRGRPNPTVISDFLAAGYTEQDLLSTLLALSVKAISNYTNHLFETPVDDAFSDYTQ